MKHASKTDYVSANHALIGLTKEFLGEDLQGNSAPEQASRNGSMKELLMNQFTISNPVRRYITVKGRKVSLAAQIAETMWVLSGRNDVEFLSNYLPRAKDFSDDGSTWRGGYGPRLRNYGDFVDQLQLAVDRLKSDPDTRQAVVMIYDPRIDSDPGKDIPCNNWIHFIQRDGRLHAHVTIRSNDLIWGWSGINQFEWSVLLEIMAAMVGARIGTITYSTTSLHLYEHHYKKAEKIYESNPKGIAWLFYELIDSGLNGAMFEIPSDIDSFDWEDFDGLADHWFAIEAGIRTGYLDNEEALRLIEAFPEPMLQSFLKIIFLWWTGKDLEDTFPELSGKEIGKCYLESPKNKKINDDQYESFTSFDKIASLVSPSDGSVNQEVETGSMSEYTINLHEEKNKAYGNSWRKRGEVLGILANLARKVDRLGADGGGDTALDTAIDLFVYAVKYRVFLESEDRWDNRLRTIFDGESLDFTHEADISPVLDVDDTKYVSNQIKFFGDRYVLGDLSISELEDRIRDSFKYIEQMVQDPDGSRSVLMAQTPVRFLIASSHDLALRLWNREQWKKSNEKRSFNGYNECE